MAVGVTEKEIQNVLKALELRDKRKGNTHSIEERKARLKKQQKRNRQRLDDYNSKN